ncbi:MAG TPA: hypothetical protein VLZ33_03490 [Dysgonamonadaceae bacterium]|nr:hypothetical protein [Dysgonamonadaceae bacterium]
MKKILFALAMLPILAFVGCSSDDDNSTKVDFDHNIEWLYGEWRATSVEGVVEEPIDLTDPVMEMIVEPTYITFGTQDVYSSKGILGEGSGKYTTKGITIIATIGEDKISFDMKELSAETAKIEINAEALGLPIIPEGIEEVIVVLTKQKGE